MRKDRLEWAIRTKQKWPLIKSVEGCTYEQYRKAKAKIKAEQRAERERKARES